MVAGDAVKPGWRESLIIDLKFSASSVPSSIFILFFSCFENLLFLFLNKDCACSFLMKWLSKNAWGQNRIPNVCVMVQSGHISVIIAA